MKHNRRQFIRQAGLLAGGIGMWEHLPASVRKAMAIDPEPGSSFLDAEHIVVLMQENRSFDHAFGCLQGVRGFNDPRALSLPGGNKVWLQQNAAGQTYLPFRLNIRDTRSTWMGSLPHSWTDMLDAWNEGKMDRWLEAKKPGNKDYAGMPLTMGYYNRDDLPFYYALADAFTICDQHFCSSLTGTTPNRLHLWAGTIRDPRLKNAPALVRNSDLTYSREAAWRTFPELLEKEGISWRVYQNELSLDTGMDGEEEAWLANFTDNPLEWFSQYHVRFLPSHLEAQKRKAKALEDEIRQASGEDAKEKQAQLEVLSAMIEKWKPENFDKLDAFGKALHQKAFTTNAKDPSYHRLHDLVYEEQGEKRHTRIPAGDVLYQFREDARNNRLPLVSWLVAPERFSDHPGSPWYGAWYISEVLNILTSDPETWKKTIFILTYDENDGYFDHVPPFTPPLPGREDGGKVSPDIDPAAEYVSLEEETAMKGLDPGEARGGPIGLGFRVPMIVASPWSRGGKVNSQVFDHTSVLQFMEHFLSKKTGKTIREENISAWRRAVCGDLRSIFSPWKGEKTKYPAPVRQREFFQDIYNAKFRGLPGGYAEPEAGAARLINLGRRKGTPMPLQEAGLRDSCPLPYELKVCGGLELSGAAARVRLRLEAGSFAFGERSAGAPFLVYAPEGYLGEACANRRYALSAGHALEDHWELEHFNGQGYCLEVYGPNGFFRVFRGGKADPLLQISEDYEPVPSAEGKLRDELLLQVRNLDPGKALTVRLEDRAYGKHNMEKQIEPGGKALFRLDTSATYGWYDFRIVAEGYEDFEQVFAGRVETGTMRKSDPQMSFPAG